MCNEKDFALRLKRKKKRKKKSQAWKLEGEFKQRVIMGVFIC